MVRRQRSRHRRWGLSALTSIDGDDRNHRLAVRGAPRAARRRGADPADHPMGHQRSLSDNLRGGGPNGPPPLVVVRQVSRRSRSQLLGLRENSRESTSVGGACPGLLQSPCRHPPLLPPWPREVDTRALLTCGFAVPIPAGGLLPPDSPRHFDAFTLVSGIDVAGGNPPSSPRFYKGPGQMTFCGAGGIQPRPALRVVPGQRQSLLVRGRCRVTVRDLG